MEWLINLGQNKILITSVSSWAIAQVLKVIINAIVTREWNWERLVGDGGMPSCHSATVSSLAAITALAYGTGSFEFAVTAILAIIVCHDAMGVRLETGKQAIVLNEIVDFFEHMSEIKLPEIDLKELVGHTPTQVIIGVLLGVGNAFFMYYIVFH